MYRTLIDPRSFPQMPCSALDVKRQAPVKGWLAEALSSPVTRLERFPAAGREMVKLAQPSLFFHRLESGVHTAG